MCLNVPRIIGPTTMEQSAINKIINKKLNFNILYISANNDLS